LRGDFGRLRICLRRIEQKHLDELVEAHRFGSCCADVSLQLFELSVEVCISGGIVQTPRVKIWNEKEFNP